MQGARRLRRRILWPEGAELLLRILRALILFYHGYSFLLKIIMINRDRIYLCSLRLEIDLGLVCA